MPANFGWLRFGAASVVIAASTCIGMPARATDVVTEWSTIQMPPAPTLKPVTVDPKTTALFLLDFMHENCGQRPRCVAALPTIKALHDRARAASMFVAYTLPGSSWYVLQADATAPANATQAAIELVATASATASVVHIDQAVLWEVLPQTAVEAFSDDGYIELTLRELTLDDELSVYREGAGGSRTLVRSTSGMVDHQVITSDLMIIEDHEAPLNVPVRYHIEIYPPGSLTAATRASDYAAITLADINQAWLKDPGNPQRNMKVLIGKAPDWQRPIEQSTFVIRGRRNKVTLYGKRQGLEGDLAIATRSNEERRALHLLLNSGNTLLWQAAPGMGVDDMYVTVGAVPEVRMGALAQDEWRTWTLPLIENDMPVTTAVNGAAGRTWQDVLTEFATWQDVLNTYATWEDVLLDQRTG